MKTNLLEDALKLPLPDRIRLADEIYRSVDTETDDTPIPAELLAEMERRDAGYEANPASACTIEEMEGELFKRKSNSGSSSPRRHDWTLPKPSGGTRSNGQVSA